MAAFQVEDDPVRDWDNGDAGECAVERGLVSCAACWAEGLTQ
jgi:hypothetical protein